MSNLQGAFEGGYQVGSVEPNTFDDLPAGDYQVIIADSEMKDTRDFTGKYLQFTYDIIEGDHKGRKIFDRLNLINRNEMAKRIATQALESICRATGFSGQLKDSSQLHRKLMVIRLGYNPKNDEGRRNEVKGYKPAVGGANTQQAPVAAPPTAEFKSYRDQEFIPLHMSPDPAWIPPRKPDTDPTLTPPWATK